MQAFPPGSTCTVALPVGGILQFNDSYTTTLSNVITYEGPCNQSWLAPLGAINDTSGNSTVVKFDDPFYASVAPQIYALAMATIMSYILVILIFITTRSMSSTSTGHAAGILGLRAVVPGVSSSSRMGVGRRPLLQKIAALTVAISLTIATADTFKVAEDQYNNGYMDANDLVDRVLDSTEIRVIRVISDTFLWLAQVQTLIRLFPRHKEKVAIKWLGFGLVVLDTIFSILENFVSQATLARPRNFQDAIPALAYLFEMAIALIYASCVIYYSLSKRRFAFWHPKMRNICLVALISLIAVLVPVVFFVLDISQPNIATWGEYVRWVGSAAASVVVWEWVERIEALEKDERKDGILGREIYDGDEMVDRFNTDPKSGTSGSMFSFGKRSGSPNDGHTGVRVTSLELGPMLPFRKRKAGQNNKKATGNAINGNERSNATRVHPLHAATAVSRSDTTSPGSTIYAVRYHNISSPSPAIPEEAAVGEDIIADGDEARPTQLTDHAEEPDITTDIVLTPSKPTSEDSGESLEKEPVPQRHIWQAVAHPFKRKRTSPPAEVAAQLAASNHRRSPGEHYQNFRARVETFAGQQRARFTARNNRQPPAPLGVTVIPARPRTPQTGSVAETAEQSLRPTTSDAPAVPEQPAGDGTAPPADLANLPVTVIPPPKRGGRTWSPADLHTPSPDVQVPTTQTPRSVPMDQSESPSHRPPTTSEPSSTPLSSSQFQRGSLRIMVSQPPSRNNNISATSQRSAMSAGDPQVSMPSRQDSYRGNVSRPASGGGFAGGGVNNSTPGMGAEVMGASAPTT